MAHAIELINKNWCVVSFADIKARLTETNRNFTIEIFMTKKKFKNKRNNF